MKKLRGFTLIELVMVIVITGILAATLTIFLRPAIDSYFDSRRRADMTDMADTALRRMSKDIRSAVPNSIRTYTINGNANCFQLVPTTMGGRFRLATDITNAGSLSLDTSGPATSFDVLSPLSGIPAVGDWIVIGNQNTNDVYTGATRGAINVAVAVPAATNGLHRITINATQFPSGYDGGRFVVVPNTEQTVFYNLVGTTLYRTVALFGATQATCSLTTGAVLATNVTNLTGVTFSYDPNQGATQQSGFLWMRLQLTNNGETVVLSHGTHVDNVP